MLRQRSDPLAEARPFRSLGAAWLAWPNRAGWVFAGGHLLWLAPLLGALGWGGGFTHWQPAFGAATWRIVAIALLFPALAEESVFRAMVIRRRRKGKAGRGPILASVLLFTAWHPLQARLYWVPWHDLALDPFFLLAVASLGLACARVFARTGSVWPCVALHWIFVASWKALFGAPLALPHF